MLVHSVFRENVAFDVRNIGLALIFPNDTDDFLVVSDAKNLVAGSFDARFECTADLVAGGDGF